MSILYEKIKWAVKNRTCREHFETPVINVDNDNVMMVCCCTPFEIECYHVVIEILSGELEKTKEKFNN